MQPNLKALLSEQGLLLATHNQGKLKEIQTLLAPLDINCVLASDKNLPEPEENGATFAENAMIKSVAAAKATGMPCLSDDSGLAVPALDGAPGIYSARWAGPEKDFSMASGRIQQELEQGGHPLDSEAYFVCMLSLALPGGVPETSGSELAREAKWDGVACINIEGRATGRLTFPPRGAHGFGYDPIFTVKGMEQTFAEIEPVEKQQISHRANAFKGLIDIIGQ